MSRDLSMFARVMEKLIARDCRLAEQQRPRRVGRLLEGLEPRNLLTTASWDSNLNRLYVYGDTTQGEEIDVSKNGSNKVTITDNGSPVSISQEPYGGLDASAVDSINVNTYGGGAESVDLSGVFASAGGFTSDLEGHVTISGGSSGDTILGSGFADSIIGDGGADELWGLNGNDTLRGGNGADTIYSGDGDDVLEGGEGNDDLQSAGGLDTHVFSGNDLGCDTVSNINAVDEDTLDFSGMSVPINVDLGDGADCRNTAYGELSLTLYNSAQGPPARHVIGSVYADWIKGVGSVGTPAFNATRNNNLVGGAGDDTILGEDGDDTVIGGGGSDSIVGGSGADVLYGYDGNNGSYGSDADIIRGGTGTDTIRGDGGNDSLFGDDGNDVIWGGSGFDTAYGGNDNDEIWGGHGVSGSGDSLFGEAGDDTIDGVGGL
jgi:Ca2+-binding RTX toxin-like protein